MQVEKVSDLANDHLLIDAVKNRRAVLFLGAGASRGAVDGKKQSIPDGRGLGAELSDAFLKGKFKDREFRYIYDLAVSAQGVRNVQKFVHDRLQPFQPADHHLLIPTFVWSSIFSTNYDLVIERAYQKVDEPLQDLVVLSNDKKEFHEPDGHKNVAYVKLHGCLTDYQEERPPLIASTDQIVNFREGRVGQFDLLMEASKTKNIVFCGHGFSDANILHVLNEFIRDGDNRPPHFIVSPDLEEEEVLYWSSKKILPLQGTFSDLLKKLDGEIPISTRRVSSFVSEEMKTGFHKHISVNARESEDLVHYFRSSATYLADIEFDDDETPRSFYEGVSDGWKFLVDELDVVRSLQRTILEEELVVAQGALPRVILVKSYAGAGRTVFLKRLAYTTEETVGGPTVFVGRDGSVDVNRIREMVSLTNKPIYLFVDDFQRHVDELSDLISIARNEHWSLFLILSGRVNEINIGNEESVTDYVDQEYLIEKLTPTAIQRLLDKLEQHSLLGDLTFVSKADRMERFQKRYDGQLLVSLYETLRGREFLQIVNDEYTNILPMEARLFYLDICSMHRLGVPVRAGLIARVHGLNFEDFRDRFFAPLEGVVRSRYDRKIGDFVYTARHRQIAEMVYEGSAVDNAERLENMKRLLSRLNPGFSYDETVIKHLTRAHNLRKAIPETLLGDEVYSCAIESLGDRAFLYQQRGLYWLYAETGWGSAQALEYLDQAEVFLEQAAKIDPHNKAISHSRAELLYRRAKVSRNDAEKAALREAAVKICTGLLRTAKTAHSWDTIAKVRLDELRDEKRRFDANPTQQFGESLGDLIRKVETIIEDGLDRFPNDHRLLSEDSELNEILGNSDAALVAMEKAFDHSPHDASVARRLARIHQARNEFGKARSVLTEALKSNPSNHGIHFQLARLWLMDGNQQDVDQKEVDHIILHHLGRSYRDEDGKHNRKLLHARQLFVCGENELAREAFDVLKRVQMNYQTRHQLRDPMKSGDGKVDMLYGSVEHCRSGRGSIRFDGYDYPVFFDLGDTATVLKEGSRVRASIFFNFLGPVARDVVIV